MRPQILFVLILSLCLPALIAADALPSGAQKAEEKFKAMKAKAMQSAQKDVDKAKQRYAKELKGEVKKQLKTNGIEAAQKVQEMIAELETSDPIKKAFGDSAPTKSNKKSESGMSVKIAIATSYHKREEFNVTKDMQKFLTENKEPFRPADIWGEKFGFMIGGRLVVTYMINGKEFEKQYPWTGRVRFDETKEEALESLK